jgi:hypothetical protein
MSHDEGTGTRKSRVAVAASTRADSSDGMVQQRASGDGLVPASIKP